MNELRVDFENLEYEMGWMLYEGVPFTGVAFENWPDGALRCEVPYLEGYKHGVEREWYQSGQVKEESELSNGGSHGKHTEWDEGGRIVVEAMYEDCQLIHKKNYRYDGSSSQAETVLSDTPVKRGVYRSLDEGSVSQKISPK